MKVNPIIRQIVDRDCHVGASYMKVIRRVISRLQNGYKTFSALPKRKRKAFLRQCIAAHKENRKLYHSVMTGKF